MPLEFDLPSLVRGARNNNSPKLVRAGAVPAALRALQRGRDDTVLECSAGLLNNIMHNGGAADAATAAAAAMETQPHLLRLVRQGSTHSQAAAGRALAGLASRPEYRQAVLPELMAAMPPGGIAGVLCSWPAAVTTSPSSRSTSSSSRTRASSQHAANRVAFLASMAVIEAAARLWPAASGGLFRRAVMTTLAVYAAPLIRWCIVAAQRLWAPAAAGGTAAIPSSTPPQAAAAPTAPQPAAPLPAAEPAAATATQPPDPLRLCGFCGAIGGTLRRCGS